MNARDGPSLTMIGSLLDRRDGSEEAAGTLTAPTHNARPSRALLASLTVTRQASPPDAPHRRHPPLASLLPTIPLPFLDNKELSLASSQTAIHFPSTQRSPSLQTLYPSVILPHYPLLLPPSPSSPTVRGHSVNLLYPHYLAAYHPFPFIITSDYPRSKALFHTQPTIYVLFPIPQRHFTFFSVAVILHWVDVSLWASELKWVPWMALWVE
ncbi:hypothetical protein E2C01_036323 [Portunus trituberculatus]|uniref:Uncharacterized protein n=1 Tax=Portunus trituberculatus TaxID=210409 RepID=A0A5B7FBL7_PORTR|nr:hypothetical protein [Portunus trituberculatus]